MQSQLPRRTAIESRASRWCPISSSPVTRRGSLTANPHSGQVRIKKSWPARSCQPTVADGAQAEFRFRVVTTVRLGSVRAVPQELDVVHGAVSQQIRSLEEMLGIKLFERKGRRLLLTQHGQRYSDAINVAFGIIERAGEEMPPAGSARAFRLGMRSASTVCVTGPGGRPAAFIMAISIALSPSIVQIRIGRREHHRPVVNDGFGSASAKDLSMPQRNDVTREARQACRTPMVAIVFAKINLTLSRVNVIAFRCSLD
jgi:Bacterial regulatory helix-turn-helix protein, lysR family